MGNEHKSDRIKQIALSYGWKAEVVTNLEGFEKTGKVEDIEWMLYAIRDKENLKVVWKNNLFASATYKYGMYELHPARTGSVVKLLSSKPDPSKLNGHTNARLAQAEVLMYRKVDWTDETTAFDILKRVLGKEIVWAKASGEIVSEMCPKDSNLGRPYFRVYTTKTTNKRVLEWCNNFGFHACYVDKILEVN